MKKADTFSDRRNEAAAAKARLVDKFKAHPADGPEAVERAAVRQAQSTAQAEHSATAALKKKDKLQRLQTEADTAEALWQAEQHATEQIRVAEGQQLKEAAEAAKAQEVLEEASRQTKRDARYANRKARR